MSPDLPRSSPSSSTPPYNSIGQDSSRPLAHLFAYDAHSSPASRNTQGSPIIYEGCFDPNIRHSRPVV
ncbi:uncharacterized protein LACBIDRAFT_296663 [Laccaria bicolor S238N-H82]|uniref:Predicted protein n=1 Tax=Laccaria bicolor (strain S238N-H82 / ATCC MYA-4686) TaxID=486041 RepID=B0D9D4_LACBS|nr:uncharacterized protein LACBIDRAFT_296663 [Laccaria bicolor S238N-H82]EDR09227.1 predicted protein [Laccaria bicolor S238N-H82]|eukprot:XP_001880540.1 predicted protein [Laccaria bicolor S238N-H82]